MQKLMTAGVVLALGLSVYSLFVGRSAIQHSDQAVNGTVVNVANVDRLINLVENSQTNQMRLAEGWKAMQDDIGREEKERMALGRVVEKNALELIRISGNLERDSDKMYTNIVMFGVSVFATQENVTALAARLQDLERRLSRSVPGVSIPVPAPEPAQTEAEKFIERFNIGPANVGPAPTN